MIACEKTKSESNREGLYHTQQVSSNNLRTCAGSADPVKQHLKYQLFSGTLSCSMTISEDEEVEADTMPHRTTDG